MLTHPGRVYRPCSYSVDVVEEGMFRRMFLVEEMSGRLGNMLLSVQSVRVDDRAGGMDSIFSPLSRFKAFFCCFKARSRLYIGPNLFRPPRIRSARTAGNKQEQKLLKISKSSGVYSSPLSCHSQNKPFAFTAIADR